MFDAADKSRAVVRLRANLIRNRGLVAQQSFGIERAAATPDAEGWGAGADRSERRSR